MCRIMHHSVLNYAPFGTFDAKFYTILSHSVHCEPNGSLVQNEHFSVFLMFSNFKRRGRAPSLAAADYTEVHVENINQTKPISEINSNYQIQVLYS
jgi:hypothetical protein